MDTIADMLTIIKNGLAAKKDAVTIPHSRMKADILNVLMKEGFVKDVIRRSKKGQKCIDVSLAYEDSYPKISGARRVSKSSKRTYAPLKKLSHHKKGMGILILSTPKGVMSDKSAQKEKVGGEIICHVW